MNQPAAANTPRFTPLGLIPTREQADIQLAQNKVTLIEANAGAAKTTTLALRIGEALARQLPPEQILALVFTPEARDVLRQRLVDIGIPRATASRVDVLTFEDFAGRELAKVDGDSVKSYRHARQLRPYVLEALERVHERYAGHVEFLDLRTHNIAISQFLDLQLGLKATMEIDRDVDFIGHEEAAETLKLPVTDYLTMIEYERLRLGGDDGALFRGPFDATYDLAHALSATAEFSQRLPSYRVLLCDELHDLNEAAFRILNALLQAGDGYFIGAGDKDQVIHSKLGASQQFLERRFKEHYPTLKHYPLTQTYRHGPHLAYAMRELKRKPVESMLTLHTAITQSHYEAGADNCAAKVVDALRGWKRDGHPLDQCTILIRDRHQSVAIENALIGAGFGYKTPEMAGYLQRDEILFLRGMIAIALKDLEAVKTYEVRCAIVEALAVFGEVALAPARMEQVKYEVAKNPQLINDFFSLYLDNDERSSVQSVISSTVAYLKDVAPDTLAGELLRDICARMNLEVAAKRIFVRPYDASVVAKSIAGFLAFATASGLNLRDFWLALNKAEAFAQRKRDKDFVFLDCVANAKGKEFEHVILPFLQDDEFPSPLADRGEEENLFYVGATRAKQRLTLISPQEPAQRSRYLGQMKLAAIQAGAAAALERNAAGALTAPVTRHYLKNSYHDRVQLKAMGATYDLTRKAWYVKAGIDLAPFAPWL